MRPSIRRYKKHCIETAIQISFYLYCNPPKARAVSLIQGR